MESKTVVRVNLVDGNKHVFEMNLEEFKNLMIDTDKYFLQKFIQVENVLINPEQIISVEQVEKKPARVRSTRGIY